MLSHIYAIPASLQPINNSMQDYVTHCFRPSDTIDGIIRLLGRHNLTPEEMVPLRVRFNELNGLIVIKPGTVCKIPLPDKAM
jgi:hypothetical protein